MILKRQHGLFVSICFVVGFIVGTGIFFLPGRVLYEVGGSTFYGTVAWIVGGLMISPIVLMFGILAAKYEKIHGFVDYSEAIVGKRYGYLAGWFFAVMYQPAGYAIIAWITSGFTAALVGVSPDSNNYMAFRFFISAFFMVMTFMMNYFAPTVPVRFNVTTTIARLIPLVAMGTVGVVIGVFFADSGESTAVFEVTSGTSVFAAISATAFAFNGWQAALAFNSEIKDSKRKFPIALLSGFCVVAVVYVLYFVGIATALGEDIGIIMAGGGANFADGTRVAFENVFGAWAAGLLVFFMIISGLGILNACCLGMGRAMYSLGRRKLGPLYKRTVLLDTDTNVPNNSMVMAVGISFLWYAVIFANTFVFQNFTFSLPDFYNFSFFALLIPIFVCYAIKSKESAFLSRFVLPSLAISGAGFMFMSYWLGSLTHAVVYLCVFAVLGLVGMLLK